jgi:hypothetical protein
MKVRLITGIVFFAALLTGCQLGGVKGSGNMGEAERMVEEFSSIEISGAYNVSIELGDDSKVFISAEDNLIPLIKTEVSGSRLKIYSKKDLRPREDIFIKVMTTDLRKIVSSGASSITAKEISSEKFYAELSGAGTIRLSGFTKDLKIVMSGAGAIDAKNFIADDVEIIISGACSGSVHANESLKAVVSGVGTINYYGNPKDVSSDVSGVGSINNKSDELQKKE